MFNIRIPLLLLSSVLALNAIDNDLGVNIGLNSINNEDGINLKNKRAGLSYQYNNIVSPIKPRLDLDYVGITDYKIPSTLDEDVSALIKGSINAVYEFDATAHIKPYVIGGVGYEYVRGAIKETFENNAFVQGGVGLAYVFNNNVKLRLEGKSLQIVGGENQDNEIIVSAGISIPLHPAAPDTNTCPKKIQGDDADRDGIEDSQDQCPNTPCYFTVNQYGCAIKALLEIHFAVNKDIIRPHSLPKVEEFATFLRSNKGSHIKIIGHTDSDGSTSHNLDLSKRRARSVANKLRALGISPTRLSSKGMGESSPIASNATVAGKSKNRRIVAKISYPYAK